MPSPGVDHVAQYLTKMQQKSQLSGATPIETTPVLLKNSPNRGFEKISNLPCGAEVHKTLVLRWKNSPEELDQKIALDPAALTASVHESVDALAPGAKLLLTEATIVSHRNTFPDSILFHPTGIPTNHEFLTSFSKNPSIDNYTNCVVLSPTGNVAQASNITIYERKNQKDLGDISQFIGFNMDLQDSKEIINTDKAEGLVLLHPDTPEKPSAYLRILQLLKSQDKYSIGSLAQVTGCTINGHQQTGVLVSARDLQLAKDTIKKTSFDAGVFAPNNITATIAPLGHSFSEMVSNRFGTSDYMNQDPAYVKDHTVEVHIRTKSIVVNNKE